MFILFFSCRPTVPCVRIRLRGMMLMMVYDDDDDDEDDDDDDDDRRGATVDAQAYVVHEVSANRSVDVIV